MSLSLWRLLQLDYPTNEQAVQPDRTRNRKRIRTSLTTLGHLWHLWLTIKISGDYKAGRRYISVLSDNLVASLINNTMHAHIHTSVCVSHSSKCLLALRSPHNWIITVWNVTYTRLAIPTIRSPQPTLFTCVYVCMCAIHIHTYVWSYI